MVEGPKGVAISGMENDERLQLGKVESQKEENGCCALEEVAETAFGSL